jgi:CRP-like cAMP-binding protein
VPTSSKVSYRGIFSFFTSCLAIKSRFKAKLKSFGAGGRNQTNKRVLSVDKDLGALVKEPEEAKRKIESLYGYNYNYSSESNDEAKYATKRNKRFYRLRSREQKRHLRGLWKTCYNTAFGCAVVISQLNAIQTKCSYFGRQMISVDNVSLRYELLMNRFNNPAWFKLIFPDSGFKSFWDILMVLLVAYTGIYAPFRTAFMSYQSSDTLFAFETITDILLLMDIFITFATPYERMDGSLECNWQKIRKNYVMSYFFFDVVAIIPFQVLEPVLTSGFFILDEFHQNLLLKQVALLRIFRTLKVFKLFKYTALIFKLVEKLHLKPTQSRIFVILWGALLLVHIFACVFYLASRYEGHTSNTWVSNRGDEDNDYFQAYINTLYWAFQTLTTVGYGDFGAYNFNEILVTCIWMFIGVAFYSFVVGSLTSVITDIQSQEDNLIAKLKALDEFARDTNLDKELHKRVQKFLVNNYVELFSKMDEEQLIQEMPPTLKEEIFYHQFGSLISDLAFLQNLDNDITWGIVKQLKKVKYEHNDRIYADGEVSDALFMIHKGIVKLYAENDFPFHTYAAGSQFGDADMFCNIRRMGTAHAHVDCLLYKLQRNHLEDILSDFPGTKRKLTLKGFSDNKELIQKRLAVLKKYPLYGFQDQQNQALLHIKDISTRMNQIHKQLKADVKNAKDDDGALIEVASEKEESEHGSESAASQSQARSRKPASSRAASELGTDVSPKVGGADEGEMQAIHTVQAGLQTLNQMVKVNSDTTPDFTQGVRGLVEKLNSNANTRSSLDFEFQKKKTQKNKNGQIRYKESTQLDAIKMDYADTNELLDFDEVRNTQINKVKNQAAMDSIKDQA